MKTDGYNQFQCIKRILKFVRKHMAASKTQLPLSQFFLLTACQQLLLHTCDRLGLKRLGINTPRVPHRDVSLLYPAVHPQYVTITQQILSLKFSAAHKMQFRQDGKRIKTALLLYTGSVCVWKHTAAQSLLEHTLYHQLAVVPFPVRWCRMSDPKTPSHLILDWLCFQSKMVCEQSRFFVYETHFWSPGYWNVTSTFLLSIKLLWICHQICGTITGNWSFPHFFQHHRHVLGLNDCKLC